MQKKITTNHNYIDFSEQIEANLDSSNQMIESHAEFDKFLIIKGQIILVAVKL